MIKFGGIVINPKIDFYYDSIVVDLLGFRDSFNGIKHINAYNLYSEIIIGINNKYKFEDKLNDRFTGLVDCPEHREEVREFINRILLGIEEDDKLIIFRRLNFLLDNKENMTDEEYEYFRYKYSKL